MGVDSDVPGSLLFFTSLSWLFWPPLEACPNAAMFLSETRISAWLPCISTIWQRKTSKATKVPANAFASSWPHCLDQPSRKRSINLRLKWQCGGLSCPTKSQLLGPRSLGGQSQWLHSGVASRLCGCLTFMAHGCWGKVGRAGLLPIQACHAVWLAVYGLLGVSC